ncbi:MAG: ABC transporter ATP-binding protein [Actinobacteria bacterium]|nr:ABC transporter ATP-binding protein [Actinomycetota bacterium]
MTHRFGRVTALDDVTFSVPAAQITVLLGPNGAGKTTAIRAITGALSPTIGEITSFGVDPRVSGDLVRPRCGVVSAKPALYDRLTGSDNLEYAAELYEVPRAAMTERIAEAAERFGITGALGQLVGGYSTGMKTRLALARAVLHRPDLLLFDEPTSGLDPESSQAVLDLVRSMADQGTTVVMCTHLLAEAEGLADHIVVLESGHTVCEGAAEALTRQYWPHDTVLLDAVAPDQLDRIAAWPGVLGYDRGDVARAQVDGVGRIPQIVAALVADGVQITRVEPVVPTLEQLYFAVRSGRGQDQFGRPVPSASMSDGGSAYEARNPFATPSAPLAHAGPAAHTGTAPTGTAHTGTAPTGPAHTGTAPTGPAPESGHDSELTEVNQ